MKQILTALEQTGKWLEDLLLSSLLIVMIGLASWQIIGRNLFGTSISSGDEFLRILVLWLTLAGAVAASRADRHISIALLDRFLHGWLLNLSRSATHVFTAVVCGFLCWHSYAFMQTSREFGDVLLAATPAWWLQAALPLGFGIMTYRHALHAINAALGRLPSASNSGSTEASS